MNTSHPRRISRKAAEALLEGGSPAPAAIPEPLTRLLATAAAPPRPGELTREDMAVAAFGAEHLVPATASERGQMITSPLAKFLTTKVIALVLATCATGGIALAATVGLHGSGSAHGHVGAGANGKAPVAGHAGAAGHASGHASGKHPAAGAGGHATGSASGSVSALCLSLAGQAHTAIAGKATANLPVSGLEQALASPALNRIVTHSVFARLTTTAGGAANVADLCALTLRLPQLPSPQAIANLPVSVLAALPTSTLASLPASVLAQLPASVLSQLPVSALSQLPVSALSQLPVSVLAQLPASVLAHLPTSVLAKLPVSVLAKLPIHAVSMLPIPVLSKLPIPVVSKLPVPVVSKLPVPVLSKLPVSALVKLPLSVLEKLPASVLAKLPASILSKLPGGL